MDRPRWIIARADGADARHSVGHVVDPADIAAVLNPAPDPSEHGEPDDDTEASTGRRWATIAVIALACLWVAAAVATLTTRTVADVVPVLSLTAAILTPILLLTLVWAVMIRRSPDAVERSRFATVHAIEQANLSYQRLTGAQARLGQASAKLEQQASGITASLEASEVFSTRMEEQCARTVEALAESSTGTGHALSLIAAIEEAAPRMEARMAALSQALARSSDAVAEQGDALERRFDAAIAAADQAEARIARAETGGSSRLQAIGNAARQAGEEMTAIAEIASARVDLTIERARGGIIAINEALDARIVGLERLGSDGDRTAAIVESLGIMIADLGQRMVLLEQETEERRVRLSGGIGALTADADRLGAALDRSDGTAAMLLDRAEALLLALDSNIREIDESLPSAFARLDDRATVSQDRLQRTGAIVETMAAAADAVAGRMDAASESMANRATSIVATLALGEAGLDRQGDNVTAMRAALEESSRIVERLADTAGPQMVAALEQVRESAETAARRAQEMIDTVVADATDRLGRESGAAMAHAVGEQVDTQLARIAGAAEQAVRVADRAADDLARRMVTLDNCAEALDGRIAEAARGDEQRDRDFLTDRSGQIITALNDAAIDVARWLDHDVTDKEWSAYLAGDKSLFARRAVRLASPTEIKRVLARYEVDAQFSDQVNRYVEEFETMLRDVLGGRGGHRLAITLLSSDLGKLYVAVAQAIERLRVE